MKTQANDIFPEIEWEITTEILECDSEERLIVKNANGKDAAGNLYIGSAEYIHDNFERIKDIQKI